MISNGVINLSPDKPAVFAAAAAALRPGGRLALADIVSARAATRGRDLRRRRSGRRASAARCNATTTARRSRPPGFEIETWRENAEYRFVSERADNATQKYGVTSISLLARRT